MAWPFFLHMRGLTCISYLHGSQHRTLRFPRQPVSERLTQRLIFGMCARAANAWSAQWEGDWPQRHHHRGRLGVADAAAIAGLAEDSVLDQVVERREESDAAEQIDRQHEAHDWRAK